MPRIYTLRLVVIIPASVMVPVSWEANTITDIDVIRIGKFVFVISITNY